MSQYRDDQEAARHRLESLEEKLAARDAELELHKSEIAERDREIGRLARELRSAGTARIVMSPRRGSGMRFMVAGAMSAVIMAGMLGFLSVHRAADVAPAVTFADFPPPTMPLAAPRLDTDPARRSPVEDLQPGPVVSVPFNTLEREDITMRRLRAKADGGKASVAELKLLKAICAHLGDRDCHDRAATLLREAAHSDEL